MRTRLFASSFLVRESLSPVVRSLYHPPPFFFTVSSLHVALHPFFTISIFSNHPFPLSASSFYVAFLYIVIFFPEPRRASVSPGFFRSRRRAFFPAASRCVYTRARSSFRRFFFNPGSLSSSPLVRTRIFGGDEEGRGQRERKIERRRYEERR